MAIRAGVYGASGYAGGELVALLNKHPAARLVFATSGSQLGKAVPESDLQFIAHEDARPQNVEAVFLALPHGASAGIARAALEEGAKVIDLSADFRMNSEAAWREWYGTAHQQPDLLPVPYGLPEINRAQLHGTALVAVPGCYPTTTLLGLYPLLLAKALAPGLPIVVDAKSGASGAGRTPTSMTHLPELYANLVPYKTGRSHRHVGEIEQELHKLDDDIGPVLFTPHLLPIDRGLLASITVTLAPEFNAAESQALYEETFDTEPMVRVLPAGDQATIAHVARRDGCVISLVPVLDRWLQITSVTDNLRKGAASQAVQNFNLMFGLTETAGLTPES
ncbi:MAG: N-acetyl-gamma-glutamyl-phosphate reductase [Anaerolineae bacterium]|nr:N-acetyl-gamma-glutamyl-phosphate reductase [Anaerolineae bacterium]